MYLSPAVYSAYQCAPNIMSISCPVGNTIFILSAVYGQFGYNCSQSDLQCCFPSGASDCVEDMETSEPADWLVMKSLCDNQQECSFETQYATLSSCDNPNIANYTLVKFECLPGLLN